jgi:hypothetical protein
MIAVIVLRILLLQLLLLLFLFLFLLRILAMTALQHRNPLTPHQLLSFSAKSSAASSPRNPTHASLSATL